MGLIKFIRDVLSDKGEPSSKRTAGFIILLFVLAIYLFKGIPNQDLVTFLAAALIALGISGFEKFTKKQ